MGIHRAALAWTAVWLFLTVTIGCGQSNRAAVSGQVSFDGKAVADGAISFVPAGDNPGLPAWGKIQAGRYSIPTNTGPALGTNRVEIRWTRKTGRLRPAHGPMPPEEEFEEAIPARYNSHSELKAEIKHGDNRFDFALHSQ